MNAFELHNEKGEPVGVWCCGKCRLLTLGDGLKNTKEYAEQCCLPEKCRYCGKDVEPAPGNVFGSKAHHEECEKRDRERKKRETLAKAEEVTSYTGWVYCEDLDGHNDGYFEEASHIPEYVENEDEDCPRPAFAFCCEPSIHRVSLENIIENLCDDAHEGMPGYLDTKALAKAIDDFNELNKKHLVSYYPDYKRKVRIDYSVSEPTT